MPDPAPPREPIVGIDLGTTNSLVAIADERGPRVIPDDAGRPLVPSVVRYEPDPGAPGGVRAVVGHDAREHATEHPRTTVSSVKRLMGRSLDDARGDLAYLPYRVVEGEHRTARVALPMDDGERVVSPQEVSAAILRTLRDQASRALGVPVRKAVVTVPAYFDDAQRQATRDAGRLAGLEVVRIVNEPTAAALAYGLGVGRAGDRPRHVVVYDLGGGTFDVSVLRLTPGEPGQPAFFQVLSTSGDTRLGGDDIDHALVALFTREMHAQFPDLLGAGPGEPAPLPPGVRRALKGLAEGLKQRLSDEPTARVEIDLGAGRVYRRTLERAELEAIMGPWVERTLRCAARAVEDARPAIASLGGVIDAVILVGGSTRTPMVRARVREFFGLEPYTALDPDQVVALGAAVQASILSGAARDALLLDVIPLSLGLETLGGAVAKLIVRNSAVPCRAREMFSTSVDGQTSIKLHVLQGEREMAGDCRSLGEFHLRGIPPMPAGIPQVEVEFGVDASGVLDVRAHERRSGKRASLQIVPNHGLSRGEIERIEAESVAHAREDMTRHRVVDLVANSTLDLKWIGERLDRLRDELDPGYRAELELRLGELRAMVDAARADWRSVDPNAFHRAKEALDRASVRLQEIGIARSLRDGG